jgi:hypothetical protein
VGESLTAMQGKHNPLRDLRSLSSNDMVESGEARELRLTSCSMNCNTCLAIFAKALAPSQLLSAVSLLALKLCWCALAARSLTAVMPAQRLRHWLRCAVSSSSQARRCRLHCGLRERGATGSQQSSTEWLSVQRTCAVLRTYSSANKLYCTLAGVIASMLVGIAAVGVTMYLSFNGTSAAGPLLALCCNVLS